MENAIKTIDLHIHSCGSTGRCTISDIAFHAMHQNPNGMVLAITDHDSFALKRPSTIGNIEFLPAIELTCLRDGKEIHIIMIYPHGVSDDSHVMQLLQSHNRDRYAQAVLRILNRKNVTFRPLTIDDIMERNPGNSGYLRAPNFARALVQMGICSSRDDAMDRYVGKYAKERIDHLLYNEYPSMEEAVLAGCSDRAIIILAHPFAYYGKNPDQTEKLIADFSHLIPEDVVGGMEVYYKKSYEDSEILEAWAQKYHLFESVGSDVKESHQPLAQGSIEFWNLMYHAWLHVQSV